MLTTKWQTATSVNANLALERTLRLDTTTRSHENASESMNGHASVIRSEKQNCGYTKTRCVLAIAGNSRLETKSVIPFETVSSAASRAKCVGNELKPTTPITENHYQFVGSVSCITERHTGRSQ